MTSWAGEAPARSLVVAHDAHVRRMKAWIAGGAAPAGLGERLSHCRQAGCGWTRVRSFRGRAACPRRGFETPPGRQLQVDFGEKRVVIGGETVRVYLFVATLGHSRRLHVRAFRHERQACWFEGLESAFRAFGGVPAEVLLDNTRALVVHHDSLTREVRFNARLLAFARHWRFQPRACAPYRARTKGSPQAGLTPDRAA